MGDGSRACDRTALARRARRGDLQGKMTQFDSSDLAGRFLIAMPGMGDPRFDRAVILVCAHSEEGTIGLIVNKPAPGASMSELMGQLKIEKVPAQLLPGVQFGGPVELARGFVLHTADWANEGNTLQVDKTFAMTGTLDVLREMAAGGGPSRGLLALGYAGWGPGQLEAEIARNAWLASEAAPRIIFELPNAAKWEAALAVLGIDPLFLSAEGGRA